MTIRKGLVLSVALLLAVAALSAFQDKPVDLTGAWSGTLTATGEQADTAYFNLTQKGAELTGTAGPSAERQVPISNGKVATVKGVTTATFGSSQPNGLVMTFDLKLVDGRLKGTVVGAKDGEKRQAAIDVGRVKK